MELLPQGPLSPHVQERTSLDKDGSILIENKEFMDCLEPLHLVSPHTYLLCILMSALICIPRRCTADGGRGDAH